jgi:hypothetical protein
MEGKDICSLLIDDGHLMNVRIGQTYHEITPFEPDYAIPLIDCNWDQQHTWQISIPKLSVLRNHAIDHQQAEKLFQLLSQFAIFQKPESPKLRVYLIVGMYDGPTVEMNGSALSYFINSLLVFCEQIHQILPLAEIYWMGPCVWYPHVPFETTYRMMHAAIPCLAAVRPYLHTLDFTIDATSAEFDTQTSLWNLPYLNRQVSKLRRMFSVNAEIFTDAAIKREVNLLRIPTYVKIPRNNRDVPTQRFRDAPGNSKELSMSPVNMISANSLSNPPHPPPLEGISPTSGPTGVNPDPQVQTLPPVPPGWKRRLHNTFRRSQ